VTLPLLHGHQVDDHAFQAAAVEVLDDVDDVHAAGMAGSSEMQTRHLPLGVSGISST